ncbi:unnamed protein product, partial [Prunus brigantina]
SLIEAYQTYTFKWFAFVAFNSILIPLTPSPGLVPLQPTHLCKRSYCFCK